MRRGGREGTGARAAESSDGPGFSERLVTRTLERYGVWLRSGVVFLCSALGVLSVDTAQLPLAVSLLLPVLLFCGVRLYSLRNPLPFALLWTLDAAALVLTGLSQLALDGVGVEVMVAAIISISAITFQHEWAARPTTGIALAGLGLAVTALADILSSPGLEVSALVRILIPAGLSRAAFLIVRARARSADRAAAARAASRREAEAAAARRATEREYLATLHDTANATLLTVSHGDGRDWSWLPQRARRDLEALSAVPGFETGSIDLAALLSCVPEGEGPNRVRLTTHIEGPLVLPSGAGLAIFNGVREAVSNVARHAGVREAELRAWMDEGGTVVELSDAGRGFDPASVSPRRRGVSGSIIGRMEAVGGSASVTSQPGGGTRVHWRWHDRARAAWAGDESVERPQNAPAPQSAAVNLIRKQLLFGAQLAALLISLVSQFSLSLHQLTAYQSVYRPGWAQTAAFVGLLVVAVAGAAYLLRGRPIPPMVRWCSLGAVLAVSATCALTLPAERLLGPEDWAFGLIGWYALFLLADLRVRVFAVFLGVHVGLNAVVVLLSASPTAEAAAVLGIATVSNCGFQLSVGVLTRVFHNTAPIAGTAAAREEELRLRERINEDRQKDHKERYRALTATTVPLLVGLGHGVLSPHDEEVRLRCGVEAARMRRLFAEGDSVSDPLLNELRACVEVVEHQGVTVNLAVRGQPGDVPVEVRRELVDPVAVALGRTRSTARLTVVWTSREVCVSVVSADCADGLSAGDTAGPRRSTPDAAVSVARTALGGSVWVEASWTKSTVSGSDPT
ncbi:sensor histidine kinase [Prauserella cavernicola]|uniref:Histidine kinase/HSP90-like ATPase domain-containing protein n=1 Tax=Prauserella cavernicola TaxID=2800127 RepID=A0A934QVV0_9PSEU|nr:ATP-binding protein [Prauserella cavernicola]MBK1789217.1 hypothetical protein [Prauserella cavernicola]